MPDGRLSVGSFAITAVVPRDQRPLPWLAGDLRELVPRLVVPRLAAALDARLPESDESVWLIRHLAIDLAVAARWSADQIADRIATAIVTAIQHALQGDTGTGVVQLADRAEHLAGVLRDVVAGGARRWQHGTWAAAADRPQAEAVATILRESGDDGPKALIRLGPAAALRTVRLLDDRSATELARSWGLVGPAPVMPADVSVQSTVRQQVGRLPADMRLDGPHAAILLLAMAGAALSDQGVPALTAAVRTVLSQPGAIRLRTGLEGAPPPAALGDSRAPPDPARIRQDPVSGTPRSGWKTKAASATSELACFTTQAALFLLWRSAIESGALRHAENLAGNAAAGAISLARALVGPAADPARDPVVRLLLRLDPDEDPPDSLPVRMDLPVLLEAMAADDWRKPTVSHAVLEAGSGPGEPAVLADAATGLWLWVWPGGTPDRAGLRLRLGAGVPLLADAALAEPLAGDWRVVPADVDRVWLLPPDTVEPAVAPALQHLPGRLRQDLADLTPACPPIIAHDGLIWACLAQRVMRDLARRVPGFTHAGPAWLRANLLPAVATVALSETPDGTTLAVVLEPPPLAMMLRIAGLAPLRYRLPGSPQLTVDLAFAGR